ncbi:MAG: hypothetical protein DCC67_05090 [Planctomycetota bacterium]|nr:MAG: hypothetical protein DCC67_05090 [Planctomycetota bacterium]
MAAAKGLGGRLDALRAVAPAAEVLSPRSGYLAAINTERLGQAIIAMRGGRRQLGDPLDHSTGIEMLARLGDAINVGEPLLRFFAEPVVQQQVRPMILEAMQFADDPPSMGPLIVDRIA